MGIYDCIQLCSLCVLINSPVILYVYIGTVPCFECIEVVGHKWTLVLQGIVLQTIRCVECMVMVVCLCTHKHVH